MWFMNKFRIFIVLMALTFSQSAASGELADADSPAGHDLIVEVRVTGGLCAYGLCYGVQKIFRDGYLTSKEGEGPERKIAMDGDEVKELLILVEEIDFDIVRGRPFTGICPEAYDGRRYRYSFYTGQDAQEIDSCQHEIAGYPVFEKINKLLSQWY